MDKHIKQHKEEEEDDGDTRFQQNEYLADPSSQILAPVQNLITEQLKSQNEDVYLKIKEESDRIEKLEKEREFIGTELYGAQHQLARLQENLERAHDNYKILCKIREDIENKKIGISDNLNQRKKEVESVRREYYSYRNELTKLSERLRSVEIYNEKLVGDISHTKRITYKTEETMSKMEQKKKEQDYLIDAMNRQVKQLQENIALYESQLESQKHETRIANETKAEANAEMEAINFESKQLHQQWKSSMIGMQRRDEALKQTEEGLRKQQEQLMELDNEKEGYKKQIEEEKEKHKRLTANFVRSEQEQKFLAKQIEEARDNLESNQKKYMEHKKMLEMTEEETRKAEQEGKSIRNEISLVEKQIVKIAENIRKLQDEQHHILSEQTTFKKGAQSALQRIEKIKSVTRDKELEMSAVENELARIKIDKLQTQTHNKQLKDIANELIRELEEKDKLIEKYEVEIKRKHDEIERKQTHLDKLNRMYEKLTSDQTDENLGPLEATIKNLSKSIEAKDKENEHLKKDWIRYQNELVNLINKSEDFSETLRNKGSEITILSQKKIRVASLTSKENEDMHNLSQEMERMHVSMKKMNNLISKNSGLQKQLEDTNYDLENEIMDRLKQREHENEKLRNFIYEVRDEKNRLLDELVEIEKQIMYWEKKIELQKEIKKTLDPTVGQTEITKIKKEIHLMEQRLLELRREQKRKVKEMEKSVEKRQVIVTKGKAVMSNPKKGDTKAAIQRELARLEKTVSKKKADASKLLQEIKKSQQIAEEAAIAITNVRSEIGRMRQELNLD